MFWIKTMSLVILSGIVSAREILWTNNDYPDGLHDSPDVYSDYIGDVCTLTLTKDGDEIADFSDVVAVSGSHIHVYCVAYCSGSGSLPALAFEKDGRPVSQLLWMVHFESSTSEPKAVLQVLNMQTRDDGMYTCKGWFPGEGCIQKSFYLSHVCPWNHFLCDVSMCVPIRKLCDGIRDCKDGSDERKSLCDPKTRTSTTLSTTTRQKAKTITTTTPTTQFTTIRTTNTTPKTASSFLTRTITTPITTSTTQTTTGTTPITNKSTPITTSTTQRIQTSTRTTPTNIPRTTSSTQTNASATPRTITHTQTQIQNTTTPSKTTTTQSTISNTARTTTATSTTTSVTPATTSSTPSKTTTNRIATTTTTATRTTPTKIPDLDPITRTTLTTSSTTQRTTPAVTTTRSSATTTNRIAATTTTVTPTTPTTSPGCPADNFKCKNGDCILQSQVCDSNPDCLPDKDDELNYAGGNGLDRLSNKL
ncbi:mucin-5AC-like [Dreissena polymorpha]|uniref:mucin-5AC-like n=1 Tax=Dreissena polymorpha TaxID=45954 RepID=UPI002263AFEE|nr:mucin-5AC-like [Dreissena polymorpha]